jgi:hypothetical protein
MRLARLESCSWNLCTLWAAPPHGQTGSSSTAQAAGPQALAPSSMDGEETWFTLHGVLGLTHEEGWRSAPLYTSISSLYTMYHGDEVRTWQVQCAWLCQLLFLEAGQCAQYDSV